ncbi:Protein CBG27288 [Caenorhabditis briggsae]|uniref:Protein CBG27288 n=1 Tax=Caenorhabditis briggsae TaxID=6238 RepID=B6IE42_CAEBR|nr:Protein CBG27288 [Caenorhabditis briggsae]CAS01106.1 Protein CBG27288 [Caenorhabditis briggsae]
MNKFQMDETVVKEEIIEEEFNFTFKNGEYAEVKQEEIERKPEYLLEQEIKINPSELFEADEPDDEFFEAVQLKKVSITGTTKFKCGICQKMMPKNCLKLFKSEDNKTVLAEMFKIKGFNNTKTIFVCVSHIQTIIDDYDGKWKLPKTPFEQLLRSFITQNKRMMQVNKKKSIHLKIRVFRKDMTSSRADCGIGLLPKRKIRNEPIDFSRNKNSDKFFENTELKPKKSDYKTEKEMIGAVIKEEVIEEKHYYAFKNENFVEVKQEEIEQKPEYLLEQEIKMEPIDFFDANKSDSFFDDVELNPKENYSKGEKVSAESTKLKCEICQKTMPRNLLQLIKSEDNKTVLAEMFKLEGSLETRIFYICVSHIQMIIDDNDGQLKSTSTRSEQRLRTFISTHKKLILFQTLSVANFNSLIDALMIRIEENRIRRNATSISLKSLLKHLQLYLIRPLRSEEALESISQKIQEIGDNNDEVPPTLIGEILNFFLISTGFCAQFDEYFLCLSEKKG